LFVGVFQLTIVSTLAGSIWIPWLLITWPSICSLSLKIATCASSRRTCSHVADQWHVWHVQHGLWVYSSKSQYHQGKHPWILQCSQRICDSSKIGKSLMHCNHWFALWD
jgi:hypothetical protein